MYQYGPAKATKNNQIISLIKDINLTIERLHFTLNVEVINQIMLLLNG